MDLYLVRHGVAFDPDPAKWPDDNQRPLTPEGEEELRRAARGLAKVVTAAEVVLCSPLPRARRTAVILQEDAGWPPPRVHDPLAGARPEDLLESLDDFSDAGSIALVGHEPTLGALVSLVIAGSRGAAVKMGTGSMAHVTVENLRPGAGRLVRLLQSDDLARMATDG